LDRLWSPLERLQVEHVLREAIIGGPETVRQRLDAFVARTGADELMITSHIFDHAARLRSYEIVASVQ
jgi:alkanesulfonate monooxygenase SsuD/methylene tetrahydromethanopterin reductase-like flavin-dependent oxidoreductase (luciferase family)